MKRFLFRSSILFLACPIEIDAQVVMITPDSLTEYQNSLRFSSSTEEPNNPTFREITVNKKKENNPIKGKKTVLYDPLDPTKRTVVLKALPKK